MYGVTGALRTEDEGREVVLFTTDVGAAALCDLGGTREQAPRRLRPRGTRIDHFRIEGGVLAVRWSAVPGSPPANAILGEGHVPSLVIGGADGQLRWALLALPWGSERRRRWFKLCRFAYDPGDVPAPGTTDLASVRWPKSECLSNVFGLTGAMGFEWRYRWLRVIDPGRMELFRYSLHLELEAAIEEVLRERTESGFENFSLRFTALVDEVQHRQPPSSDGAKILWEGASKLANQLASSLVCGEAEAGAVPVLLRAYLDLNRRIDAVCNRWMRSDARVEAATLMHSGAALVDWADLILLSVALPFESGGVTEKQLAYHFLEHIVRPRLTHPEPVVPLEMLRVLNLALVRAVHWLESREPRPRLAASRHGRGEWVEGTPDLMHLLTAVAKSAADRRGSLVPTDPIYTEVSRFFALCVRLVPDAAAAVGLVLSESGLFDGPSGEAAWDLRLAVMQQYDLFLVESHEGEAPPVQPPEREEFRAYVFAEWTGPAPAGARGDEWYTNADILWEVRRLGAAADALRALGELRSSALTEFLAIETPRYYALSQRVLSHLAKFQANALLALRGQTEEGVQDVCSAAVAYLRGERDLMEPQRTKYLAIPEAWREQADERFKRLNRFVGAVSDYFRHRNPIAAESVVHSVRAVILQYLGDLSDARPWVHNDVTLRSGVGRWLEERGTRYPDFLEAHRASYAARDMLLLWEYLMNAVVEMQRPNAARQTAASDIGAFFSEMCVGAGCTGSRTVDGWVDGPPEVWRAILHLLVQNAAEHGSGVTGRVLYLSIQGGRLEIRGGRGFGTHLAEDRGFPKERWSDPVFLAVTAQSVAVERHERTDAAGMTRGRGLRLLREALAAVLGLRVESRLHQTAADPEHWPLVVALCAGEGGEPVR